MLAFNSPTDRMMARVALTIFSLGALYGIYSFGQPVYWRLYATHIRPFEDPNVLTADPFEGVLDGARSVIERGATPAILQASATSAQAAPATVTTASPSPDPPSIQIKIDPPSPIASPPPVLMSPPASSSKPPPAPPVDVADKKYELSRPLIDAVAKDGYIMVTWANEHYLDFAKTWVANLKRQGITYYLVGAMDDDMLRALVGLGINTWRMNTGITKTDLGWGSSNFHKMGRSKINLIRRFLDFDHITLIMSDIDTAWVRDPMPFFQRFSKADILTSTDELRPTVKTENLERWPNAGAAFNIGIMVFRPTSKPMVDEWLKKLEDPNMWDQNAFNDLIRQNNMHSGEDGLFKGWDQKMTVGILPAAQFSSGHVFFVQRKYEEFGLKPYVAHATFQYSGTPGKRHRFREFMLFEDPPEYYDAPEGFIAINMDIPPELLTAANGERVRGQMTADKLAGQFQLVHHQLLRLRAAVALAQLTGRILVMPPIWCELDKYWAPLLDGNIPGSQFKKPFICPMDHVLDIEGGWFPPKAVSHFGPQVQWREYSFFDNPRMPAAVKNNRLKLEVCAAPGDGCMDGSATPQIKDNVMKVKPGLNSDQLSKLLGDVTKPYKVLEFSNLASLWPPFAENGGWFVDNEKHQAFVRRIKHMTSVACCLQTQPGWVWYDLLHDVPHTDRFNRKFDSWHIKLGDSDLRPKPTARRALLGVDTVGNSSVAGTATATATTSGDDDQADRQSLQQVGGFVNMAAEPNGSTDTAHSRAGSNNMGSNDDGQALLLQLGERGMAAQHQAAAEQVSRRLSRALLEDVGVLRSEGQFLHAMHMSAMFSLP